MVASKTKKVIKYTYAERVLGSFSLIQREHKKHAIHLASLRAQVLKTANARKDKLGPHWKNWVGKAVHRLEEDGILSSETAGTVALMPDGKKAILAARRALALPAHDSLSPDEEDLLWKQVTHPGSVQFIAPAVKRTRHADDSSDEEDSEPEYVPPKSRKRARTSLAAGKTTDPAFKMTKAQLVEELANLKRAREADRLRAASPLTELEDDENEEVMRLKEILKHKDEEMLALQRQLANHNSEDAGSDPIDIDIEMSSPLRPNLNAIIRTQSGSLIDHLSKQPTPAPTERDPDDRNDDNMFDEPDPVSALSSSFISHLVTPDATPAKTQPKTQISKISSLEHALQLRTTELQNLVRKLSEIESQYVQAEKSLSHKDSRISILQTNLALCESQISEKDTAISQIPGLERAKADLETSIADKAGQVERLIRERDDAVANLKHEKNEHERELSRLRVELSDSRTAVATHVFEVETVNARAASLESKFMTLQSELDSQRAAGAELLTERARLEAELSAQRELVGTAGESEQALAKRVTELDQHVQGQNAVELSLKEELARAVAESSTASEKLLAAEKKNEALAAHLAETTDKLTAAQQGLSDARAAAEALKPQMAALDDALTKRISSQRELQERLTKTQRDTDTFRLKVGILETTASNLRANLEAKKLEAEQLTRELAERTGANVALVSSLKEKEQQLTDTIVSKDTLQTTLDEVTSKLQLALSTEAQVQESWNRMNDQLAQLDTAKSSLMRELAAASAMVEETAVKLREAESREEMLGTEVTTKDQEIQRLRMQLGESVERIREVEQSLEAAESRYASDIAERESANIALGKSLSSAREDIARLTLELNSLQTDRDDMQRRLEGDVRHITDVLDAEKLRRSLIETECEDANGRIQEVEQELLELRASKDADAATIEGLKGVFSQLKATQMQSLAELDNKLESTHSTPVPRRRASKVPSARSA
ncbi:Aminotransferase [Mycena venus]|uniref:Aminotransferase n=1 Tax=Mycena venus TaxID=2733690 RepID=A0A8H7D612_9AGAR|nr:Aminotransferase [Mycena venus]